MSVVSVGGGVECGGGCPESRKKYILVSCFTLKLYFYIPTKCSHVPRRIGHSSVKGTRVCRNIFRSSSFPVYSVTFMVQVPRKELLFIDETSS